jgi:hypothetical protein
MSVEVTLITKLQIAENVCIELQKEKFAEKALPTIIWMQDEINNIREAVLSVAGTDKKKRSWLNVADRKLESIYSLREDLPTEKPSKPEKGSDLFLISVIIFIMHDMQQSARYKNLIAPLVSASYSLEKAVKFCNSDSIIDYGAEFVERIYKKMAIA